MITAGCLALAAPSPLHPKARTARRPISLRSTQMSTYVHQELARAHLQQRLRESERQRLATSVVRLAKARRASRRAERRVEQASLRLLAG